MNSIETTKQAILVIEALLALMPRLMKLARRARLSFWSSPSLSYENLLLDVTLDLRDAAGQRAKVTCRQRVRFLVDDTGVIESPIWGDGDQLARYEVAGARKLGERPDGPKRTLLLGLARRPARNRCATIEATRQIRDGFTAENEYFETAVQRPTKRLRLTVLFPRSRPPDHPHLVSSTGERLRQPRLRLREGRASLRWGLVSPKPQSVYSLRWAW